MHTIKYDIDRPSSELVAEFEGIPSAILSDVTGNVGITMDHEIKPVYRGAEMAGSAVTVKVMPGDNLVIHKALTMLEPGDVLVIDGDGYVGTAYLGEIMSTSCQALGSKGIVIDGAVRDRMGIADIEFPVFARGIHPKGPYKQDPGSINVPVTVGGMTVEPGDIVVGDDDGVAVVPPDDAESVLEGAREKLADEEATRERAASGEYLYEMGGFDMDFENVAFEGASEQDG